MSPARSRRHAAFPWATGPGGAGPRVERSTATGGRRRTVDGPRRALVAPRGPDETAAGQVEPGAFGSLGASGGGGVSSQPARAVAHGASWCRLTPAGSRGLPRGRDDVVAGGPSSDPRADGALQPLFRRRGPRGVRGQLHRGRRHGVVEGGPTTTGRDALAEMVRRTPYGIVHVTVDAIIDVEGDRAAQDVTLLVVVAPRAGHAAGQASLPVAEHRPLPRRARADPRGLAFRPPHGHLGRRPVTTLLTDHLRAMAAAFPDKAAYRSSTAARCRSPSGRRSPTAWPGPWVRWGWPRATGCRCTCAPRRRCGSWWRTRRCTRPAPWPSPPTRASPPASSNASSGTPRCGPCSPTPSWPRWPVRWPAPWPPSNT